MVHHIAPIATADDLVAVCTLFRAYADSVPADLACQDFAGELAGLRGKYAPPPGCVTPRSLGDTGEVKRRYVAPARTRPGARCLVDASDRPLL